MKSYDGGMTTKAVAADVDPLSLERQVCIALAITNRAVVLCIGRCSSRSG
jgi:hypothetical protein